MRLLILSVSVLCTAYLGATCAIAQTGQWGQAEDQIPPYQTHMDRRHGHDHVYPDRGAIVRDVPRGATTVNYAGLAYRFAGGVWYQRLGPAYMVVAPPIGVIVPQLPAFATSFSSAGKMYLYADDVFYRPRPDLGGYEVVNDPGDVGPEQSHAPAGAASSRLASAAPTAPTAPEEGPAKPRAQPPKPPAPPATPTVQPPTPAKPTTPPVQPKNMPVTPAAPAAAPAYGAPPPTNPTGVAIHPRNGQSEDQQALDRYECYRFAVGQTGFDPLSSNSGTPPDEVARRDSEYSRAQAACLEARGYALE